MVVAFLAKAGEAEPIRQLEPSRSPLLHEPQRSKSLAPFGRRFRLQLLIELSDVAGNFCAPWIPEPSATG